MAKLRNITDQTFTVLGRTVGPDEVLEIPDAEFGEYAWPESLWSVVSTRKPKVEE